MTAVEHIADLELMRADAEQAFRDEKACHEATSELLDYWRERAERAECRVQELESELEASTQADLLVRYRRVCVELDALKRQVARTMRGAR